MIRTALAILAVLLLTAPLTPRKPKEPRQPRTPRPVLISVERPEGAPEPGTGPRNGAHPSAPAPAPTATPGAPGAGGAPNATERGSTPRPGASVPDRIAAAWPGDDAKALRVTGCESDHKPTAVGAVARDGSRYQGLWQFDRQTYRSVGGTWPAVNDSVEEQTRRAWDLRQRRGWRPWPVCGKR